MISKECKLQKGPILFLVLNLIALFLQAPLQNSSFSNLAVLLLGFVLLIDILFFILQGFRKLYQESCCTVTNTDKIWTVIAILFTLELYLIMIWWLNESLIIHQYDSVVYWEKAIHYAQRISEDFFGSLSELRTSLANEYTDLPAFPIAILMSLTGSSFLSYCVSIFTLYYIPAALGLAAYICRVWARHRERPVVLYEFSFSYTMLLTCVTMLFPIFTGMLDVVGVLIISVLLNLSLTWDWSRFTVRKCILLSLFSVTLLLSRRWYAFFIVGFYFSHGVILLYEMVSQKKWLGKQFCGLFYNLIFIAGLSCVVLFVLNSNIFSLFFSNQYKDAYSAYKTVSLFQDVWNTLKAHGIWTLIPIAAGLVSMIRSRNKQPFILLTGTAIVATLLFFHIQNMGPHHRYLVSPILVCFLCWGVLALAAAIKSSRRQILLGASILLSGCCIINSYALTLPLFPVPWNALLTSVTCAPPQLQSIEAIQAAAKDLRELTDGQGKSIYICGEGELFSQELFRKSDMPHSNNALPSLLQNSIVDLRDAFPSSAFLADYIVIQDTFETDYQEEQLVSKGIWDMVQNSSRYQPVKNYAWQGGSFTIYEKTVPAHWSEIKDLENQLELKYPGNEGRFSPNWFISLENINGADYVNYLYETQNEVRKQAGVPLELSWNLDGHFDRMSFDLVNWIPGIHMQIWLDDTLYFDDAIGFEGSQTFSFDTGSKKEIRMLFTGAENEPANLTFISTNLREAPLTGK